MERGGVKGRVSCFLLSLTAVVSCRTTEPRGVVSEDQAEGKPVSQSAGVKGRPSRADKPNAATKKQSATESTQEPRSSGKLDRMNEREVMVRRALSAEGIDNPAVLSAMRRVPRHAFVPEAFQDSAYKNRPLPIGHGQTISQPYIVAAMTQAVTPKPTDKCLEIGTGSGYQAAVLAELCKTVYSIEYLPEVAEFGEKNLRRVGYSSDRVELRVGDGYRGWPEAAPFDVIVVTAAPDEVPKPLLDQLADGGRLVIPVGPEAGVQTLELWRRLRPGQGAEAFEHKRLMDVRFVPFLGDSNQAE